MFNVGFKILWRNGMWSTRCSRSEASDQGKNCLGLWPTRRKFSKPSGYLQHGVYAVCTVGSGQGTVVRHLTLTVPLSSLPRCINE